MEWLESRELLSVYTVQNTNDDLNSGSLRWALTQAQTDPDPTSQVWFQLGGAGVKTIALGSPLPTVSHPTVIDGSTQGNYTGQPLIELDASALKTSDVALTVTAGGSTIKALTINGCPGTAILLDQGGGNLVTGCYIGTNADGTAAKANGVGISIAGSKDNTIGGTATGAGNIIAGNTSNGIQAISSGATGLVIQGNQIGVSTGARTVSTIPLVGFAGLQYNDAKSVPPGTSVAVGNFNDVIEVVNGALRFSDIGGANPTTMKLSDFFPAATAPDLFAPKVFYDELAGRFVVSALEHQAGTSGSFLNVAFSDAGNEASFSSKYRIDVSSGGNWAASPTFGYNADAIVFSFNLYNPAGTTRMGAEVLSIAASSIGAGSLTTVAVNRPSDYSLAPAMMHGATAGQPMYFVESDPVPASSYSTVRVMTWANPLIAASTFGSSVITVPAYADPADASQPGTTAKIDTGDTGIAGVAWLNNRLVATHTIGSAAGDANVRWYEFATDASNAQSFPTLAQAGNISRGVGVATYSPAIAIQEMGSIGLTYVESSSTENMSMYVTNQIPGMPAGATAAPYLAQAGAATYVSTEPPPYLAGPTGSIVVNPSGGSFLAANEYASASQAGANWGTWLLSFTGLSTLTPSYKAIGNGGSGIFLNGSSGVVIGGTVAAAANVIGANGGGSGGGSGITALGTSGGLLIQGDFIGTDPSGSTGLGNVGNGINLSTNSNTVGGTSAAARNVIAGNGQAGIAISNASNNVIQGNFVGVANFSNVAVPNRGYGIVVTSSTGTTIGGTVAGAGNVVSGNGTQGIEINAGQTTSSGTLIAGNIVGLNALGTIAVPNSGYGIFQNGADLTTIGGTVAAARNVISGNRNEGISMGTGDHSLVVGNYIGTDITGTKAIGNSKGLIWTNASYATVGGTTAAARNVISGNTAAGIDSFVLGSGYEVIQGNYIGVDVTGIKALPNGGTGMRISGPTNNTIGGTTTGAGNVIAANNGNGIEFTVGPANGTVVQGNYIGTTPGGATNLGNVGTGIVIWSDDVTVGGTAAGAGNVIAYNRGNSLDPGDGIRLVFDVHHNTILSNSIHDNTGLGINFGNGPTPNHPDEIGAVPGPNDYQNYPVLGSAVSTGGNLEVIGSLNAGASTQYVLQFFWNPTADPSGHGEGQYLIGTRTMTTDASHNAPFDFTFPGANVPGGSFVTATATDPDGNTSEFALNAETVVVADLSITGSASTTSPPVHAGGTMTYTFTITNAGPDPAHGVVFTDALPASLSYAGSFTASVGGVTSSVSGRTITATLPTIAAGGSVVLSFQVNVLLAAVPSVSNTATVSTTDFDPNPNDDTVTVTTAVAASADLAVSSLAVTSTAPYYVGQDLTYAITVVNNGPSPAAGVSVVDTLPANVTFVSATGGVTPVAGKLTFAVGNLAANASATFSFTVIPLAAATASPIVDGVTVDGSDFDPDTSNNAASVSTTITPSADVSVTVTSDAALSSGVPTALAGQLITYTITAANGNLSPATGVIVTDTIPKGSTFVSATGGATPNASGVITFPTFGLAANASTVFTVQVKAAAVSTSTVTSDVAKIVADQNDPSPANNTATASVTVNPLSDRGVTVTGPGSVYVGEPAVYVITISNAGPSADIAAVVVDTLPSTVVITSAVSSTPGVTPVISGNTVTTNLGTLGVTTGLTTLPTITVTVIPQAAAAAAGIVNTATISGNSADQTPSNGTATTSTTVVPSADLAVSLTAASSALVESQLVYTLKVTNNGLSPATGVSVVDVLPADVTFVSATGGIVPVNGKLTFDVGSLDGPGGANSATFNIIVTPNVSAGNTTLTSTATVSGAVHDPDPSNDTSTATTAARPAIDLTFNNVLPAVLRITQVGESVPFSFTVTNKGPSTATHVTIISPLATGASYVAGSGVVSPSGTVALQGTSIVASVGTLAAGASATVSFTVTPGVVGSLVVNVTASATETDTDPSSNTSSQSVTVVDRVGTFAFSSASYSVNENAGTATLTVNRTLGARGAVQVDYQTVAVNALPGYDYTPVSGTLSFADGETSKTIVVPVLANPYGSGNELVNVVLSNVRSDETLGAPVLGTPSTATLTIVDLDPNTTPLTVTAFQWTGTTADISQVFVTFSKPLIPSTALNPNNYLLQSMGPDGKYGTGDESQVPAAVTYDPSNFTVAIAPGTPLPANAFFHLILKGTAGGLMDIGGYELSGDGSTAGTNYAAMFARGTNLAYYTPTNQLVTLTLARGGFLDDLLYGNGQGQRLTVVNRVAHRSVLSGTVKTLDGKNGQAYLGQTIWGLGKFGDVRVKMHAPRFLLDYYPFSPGSKAAAQGTKGTASVSTSPAATATASARAAAKAKPAARAGHAPAMSRPFHAFHR
ncbi:beta strand repeat-containing protein [Aquisphaera insulae]|uniref:beta strand repeat-containing protein n=1 Tax=Aquisphaera insulae TaxID=2712864 RepID=UPI0013EDF537|nr:Calx-beta domain-containing protein [Aquisphaera insulae]